MIADIDLRALEFISRLSRPPEPPVYQAQDNRNMRGAGTVPILDLGEVMDVSIFQFDPVIGQRVTFYQQVDGGSIGLNSEVHAEYAQLVEEIMESQELSGKSDFNFLLEMACEWLIEAYENEGVCRKLSTFLLDSVRSNTRLYTFSFRMDALQLEKDFFIGTTRYSAVSEEQARAYCNQMSLSNRKPLDEGLWKTFNGEFAVIRVRSTRDHAKQLAQQAVEMSTDVLKCFCYGYSTHFQHVVPDLKHRKNGPFQLVYWQYADDQFHNPKTSIEMLSGTVPIALDSKFLEKASEFGLHVFSEFIKTRYQDSLYLEIEDTIRRFSNVVSTPS